VSALEHILARHPVWRGGAPAASKNAVPTGFAALDAALPGGGWPVGALAEVLAGVEGVGELQLVLPAMAALSWAGRRIAWLAPPHLPYAPALAAAGVNLAQLVVVRASWTNKGRRDALWAAEQALRSGTCHALLAWFRHARYDELRRLAVAAEASPACVVLFRPPEAAVEPSPAVLRLLLEPGLSVRVLKRRGMPAGTPIPLPVKRPANALGRTSFPVPGARPRAARRVGVPVHA
jgi:cell division inhibitor SulA/protein ImuA